MADNDNRTEGGRFSPSVPPRSEPYALKGSSGLDWGMQSRLARVFRPSTSRTVMLAIDHGYFQCPTTGLERVDLSIVPLLGYADALMTTRGMVRSTIPAASGTPIVLRASGGPSILRELSDEQIAVSMEDAARINAAAAVQVFIGGQFAASAVVHECRKPQTAYDQFLGVVFSIFAFSGWESTGPLAEKARTPSATCPSGWSGPSSC